MSKDFPHLGSGVIKPSQLQMEYEEKKYIHISIFGEKKKHRNLTNSLFLNNFCYLQMKDEMCLFPSDTCIFLVNLLFRPWSCSQVIFCKI